MRRFGWSRHPCVRPFCKRVREVAFWGRGCQVPEIRHDHLQVVRWPRPAR